MRKPFARTIRQPFSHVHKTLTSLGFKAVHMEDNVVYRLFRERDQKPRVRQSGRPLQIGKSSRLLEQFEDCVREPEEAYNSMAPDEQEIAKLGKQMKHMKTNSELLKDGLIPDPIQ